MMNRTRKYPGCRLRGLAFAAAMLVFGACGTGTPVLEQGEAYERIYVAIFYKASECGTQPAFPLVFLNEPSRFGVDACAFAIIRGECPFNEYPLVCVEAYNVDLPDIGIDLSIPNLEL